jgi:hypothetical protein
MSENDTAKRVLLDHLDSVFYGEAWHGGALLPTIREFDLDEMSREGHEGYSPWKIVLHCAFWKFVVRRALLGDQALKFGREPDDFPDVPETRDEQALARDIEFLTNEHTLLRTAVEELAGERLNERTKQGQFTFAGLIAGVAAHDVYHTAQIRNLGVRTFGIG